MEEIQNLTLEDRETNLIETPAVAKKEACYKCKKCRRDIVRLSSVLPCSINGSKVKQFYKKDGFRMNY